MAQPKAHSPGRPGTPAKLKTMGALTNNLDGCVPATSSSARPHSAPSSTAPRGCPTWKATGKAGQGVRVEHIPRECLKSLGAWSDGTLVSPKHSPQQDKTPQRPASAPLHPWQPRPVGTPRYQRQLSCQQHADSPVTPSRPQSAPSAPRHPPWRPPGKSGRGASNAPSPSAGRAESPESAKSRRSSRSKSPGVCSSGEEHEAVGVDDFKTEESHAEQRKKHFRHRGSYGSFAPMRDKASMKPRHKKNPSPFSADARSVQRAALERAEVIHRCLQEDVCGLRKQMTSSICATFSQEELSAVNIFGDEEANRTVQLLTDFAMSLPRTSPLYQKANENLKQVNIKKTQTVARLSEHNAHKRGSKNWQPGRLSVLNASAH